MGQALPVPTVNALGAQNELSRTVNLMIVQALKMT
jgi:hypothetical protein